MRKWRAEHPPTPEQLAERAAQRRAGYKPRTPERHAKDLALQAERRAANPERQRQYEREYRERHPDKIQETNRRGRERLGPEYWRQWQQARKAQLIAAYGGKCACCGETEPAFLSLDHINGGGRQERKALGNSGLFKKLRDAGWPKDGYRLLCMNCQFGFMHGRTCPHQS